MPHNSIQPKAHLYTIRLQMSEEKLRKRADCKLVSLDMFMEKTLKNLSIISS